jgi:hypothetical protein
MHAARTSKNNHAPWADSTSCASSRSLLTKTLEKGGYGGDFSSADIDFWTLQNKGAQKCGETNPETAKMQNEPGTSGGISEPELGPKICTPFIEIF